MICTVWQERTGEFSESLTIHASTGRPYEMTLDAVLLHTITGTDWVDCMTQYHVLMKWEPYKPMEEEMAEEEPTGTARGKLHLLKQEVPTPVEETTVCGLPLTTIRYTMDPDQATCLRCQDLARDSER